MSKKRDKIIAVLLWLGCLAFVSYLLYAIVGNYLWKEYDPISMDISSLGAVGAPNQNILAPFLMVYGISFIGFVTVYAIWTFYGKKPRIMKIGAILLVLMSLISEFGYSMFPLEGDKTVMTFQNTMHILVTVAVVFLSIGGLFMIAAGYRKENHTRKFGNIMLVLAIIFTVFGMCNPIGMNMGLPILGVTERLAIYSLHGILAFLGFRESFYLWKRAESTKQA